MDTIHENDGESSEASDSSIAFSLTSSTAAETSVLVVSNVLPVDLMYNQSDQKWSVQWSKDVMNLGWSGSKSWDAAGFQRVSHVGVPNAFVPIEEQDVVEALLEEMDCYPVFLKPAEASAHYQGYVKGVLHPTFHNIIDLYNTTKVETMKKKEAEEDEEEEEAKVEGQKKGIKSGETKWAKRKSWHPFMQEVAFPSHMSVATKFARIVTQVYNEGDVIWVQDYHLLHLPSLLLRKLPKANVGVFLHTPFPSSEIFRTLSFRTEILRSMLCADHIGFHQFEYARHFLTCCRRELGVTYQTNQNGSICVPFQGRTVNITCCHAGVESQHLSEILNDAKTINDSFLTNNEKDARCKIIGGCDTAEGLSGIALKILAFDRFLEERPLWRGRVRMLQVGIYPDSRPDDARRTEQDVQALVSNINMKFAKHYSKHPAVTYVTRTEEEFTIHRRLALWQIIDIFLSTCVRSGLDLHPLEYVFCRGNPITEKRKEGSPFPFSAQGAASAEEERRKKLKKHKKKKKKKDQKNQHHNMSTKEAETTTTTEATPTTTKTETTAGVVILSEFAGCCRVLQGALVVNPYSTQDVVHALDRALSMSLKERKDRRLRDMSSMYQNTRGGWVRRVLSDIIRSSKKEDLIYVGTGWGLNYRIGGYGKSFVPLDLDTLVQKYKKATKRLIVLNYSGTLIEEQGSMDQYMKTSSSRQGNGRLTLLDATVASSLVTISSSRKNTLYVVSGSDAEALSSAMKMSGTSGAAGGSSGGNGGNGKGIRSRGTARVGLAAQHGFTYRPPGNGRFKCLLPQFDAASASIWQDLALEIMQAYRTRTNGAFTWRNASTCGFSYVQADPEFGDFQAKSLTTVLEAQLRSFPVQVVRESGSVFVAPEGVDKGAFVKTVMQHESYDFILCVGDGASDETMFAAVNERSSCTVSALASNGQQNNYRATKENTAAVNPVAVTNCECVSVTVNAKPSNAKNYLATVADVHDMLERLAASEKKIGMRRSFSTTSVDRTYGGSVGLITKEEMRGSNQNLSSMVKKRRKVWADVDTRTSKEDSTTVGKSSVRKTNRSPLRNEFKEVKRSGGGVGGGGGGGGGKGSGRGRQGQQTQQRQLQKKKDDWQMKVWKARWWLLAAVATLMMLRRR